MTALATDSGRKTPARLAGSAILACQSDERLVKLVRSGHERAFDAIVQRYRNPLVAHCRRILPESRCEDAVQQAFINAHAALIASDDAVQLKPWLYAITRNAALNMLRQNGWNYEQIPLDFDGVRRPDQVFEQRIELQQTVAAMNELPERQRDALVMREFEGRSYDEIALALGANDGAVRQLLNRARVTLRHAASLLTPPPLLARAAASMPQADGRRVAEVFAGFGAAGMAKAGATALVAGTLVVGAVQAPLHDGPKPTGHKAAVARAADKAVSAHDTPVALTRTRSSHRSTHASAPSHSGSRHSGSGPSHEGESRHSGSGRSSDDARERSGSSDDGGSRSGSDDSRSGSGTSGGSGSDDRVTSGSGSGEAIETSGTSGESTSGSGTSGSGSSGSDDGATTSGSSSSGTSGSGSSGPGSGESTTTTESTSSGSGKSGSSDLLEH